MEYEESPIEKLFREAATDSIEDLEAQQWIGGYRVDFLVRGKRLVIELDGHDYHKTKQQRTYDAARGRFLQEQGYTLIRFTGSEIFKSPKACVDQTLSLLRKQPEFIRDTTEIHPSCYYCTRLQTAMTLLIERHGGDLSHPYCYYRFEMGDHWLPLSLEKNHAEISVKRFMIENGDVVFDPMVDFAVIGDSDFSQWVPLNLQNAWYFANAAEFHEGKGVTVLDLDQQMEIATLCEVWGANIRNQGWFENSKLVEHRTSDEV